MNEDRVLVLIDELLPYLPAIQPFTLRNSIATSPLAIETKNEMGRALAEIEVAIIRQGYAAKKDAFGFLLTDSGKHRKDYLNGLASYSALQLQPIQNEAAKISDINNTMSWSRKCMSWLSDMAMQIIIGVIIVIIASFFLIYVLKWQH
jgi:hypothetical protein